MKITIVTSAELEAQYLCFTARAVQLGSFNKSNYVVIPHLKQGIVDTVVLPDYPYSPSFWKSLSKLKNYSLTSTYPEPLMLEASHLIAPYTPPSYSHDQLTNQLHDFAKKLQAIFNPNLLETIEDVCIQVTTIGSPGAFSKTRSATGREHLICAIRSDLPVENCCEVVLKGIISTTQHGYSDVGTVGFHERDAIEHFLSAYTPLTRYVYWDKSTTASPKLRLESQEYLTKQGISLDTQFDSQDFLKCLTPSEKDMFLLLWNQSGTLIPFDDVADRVWKEKADEKFSLYALAKLAQSLREKLNEFGIHKQMIFTIRKQGYMLIK